MEEEGEREGERVMVEERMELVHKPIPKYRKIFHIAILIGVLYLSIILLKSAMGGH
jgi:hypothetical protein